MNITDYNEGLTIIFGVTSEQVQKDYELLKLERINLIDRIHALEAELKKEQRSRELAEKRLVNQLEATEILHVVTLGLAGAMATYKAEFTSLATDSYADVINRLVVKDYERCVKELLKVEE